MLPEDEENFQAMHTRATFQSVPCNSADYLTRVLPIIHTGLLNQAYKSQLTFSEVRLIKNQHLEDRFEAKKKELESLGRTGTDLGECFAFVAVNNENVNEICDSGMKIHNVAYSLLGNPEKGVCLQKYSDILSTSPFHPNDKGTFIVFKIMKGREYLIAEEITNMKKDPMSGYDCHISKNAGSSLENVDQSQRYHSSQYYMYECGLNNVPTDYPRHILPYMVVSFLYSGVSAESLAVHRSARPFRMRYKLWSGCLGSSTETFCRVELRSNSAKYISLLSSYPKFTITNSISTKELNEAYFTGDEQLILSTETETFSPLMCENVLCLQMIGHESTSDTFKTLIESLKVPKKALRIYLKRMTVFLLPSCELTVCLGLPKLSSLLTSCYALFTSKRTFMGHEENLRPNRGIDRRGPGTSEQSSGCDEYRSSFEEHLSQTVHLNVQHLDSVFAEQRHLSEDPRFACRRDAEEEAYLKTVRKDPCQTKDGDPSKDNTLAGNDVCVNVQQANETNPPSSSTCVAEVLQSNVNSSSPFSSSSSCVEIPLSEEQNSPSPSASFSPPVLVPPFEESDLWSGYNFNINPSSTFLGNDCLRGIADEFLTQLKSGSVSEKDCPSASCDQSECAIPSIEDYRPDSPSCSAELTSSSTTACSPSREITISHPNASYLSQPMALISVLAAANGLDSNSGSKGDRVTDVAADVGICSRGLDVAAQPVKPINGSSSEPAARRVSADRDSRYVTKDKVGRAQNGNMPSRVAGSETTNGSQKKSSVAKHIRVDSGIKMDQVRRAPAMPKKSSANYGRKEKHEPKKGNVNLERGPVADRTTPMRTATDGTRSRPEGQKKRSGSGDGRLQKSSHRPSKTSAVARESQKSTSGPGERPEQEVTGDRRQRQSLCKNDDLSPYSPSCSPFGSPATVVAPMRGNARPGILKRPALQEGLPASSPPIRSSDPDNCLVSDYSSPYSPSLPVLPPAVVSPDKPIIDVPLRGRAMPAILKLPPLRDYLSTTPSPPPSNRPKLFRLIDMYTCGTDGEPLPYSPSYSPDLAQTECIAAEQLDKDFAPSGQALPALSDERRLQECRPSPPIQETNRSKLLPNDPKGLLENGDSLQCSPGQDKPPSPPLQQSSESKFFPSDLSTCSGEEGSLPSSPVAIAHRSPLQERPPVSSPPIRPSTRSLLWDASKQLESVLTRLSQSGVVQPRSCGESEDPKQQKKKKKKRRSQSARGQERRPSDVDGSKCGGRGGRSHKERPPEVGGNFRERSPLPSVRDGCLEDEPPSSFERLRFPAALVSERVPISESLSGRSAMPTKSTSPTGSAKSSCTAHSQAVPEIAAETALLGSPPAQSPLVQQQAQVEIQTLPQSASVRSEGRPSEENEPLKQVDLPVSADVVHDAPICEGSGSGLQISSDSDVDRHRKRRRSVGRESSSPPLVKRTASESPWLLKTEIPPPYGSVEQLAHPHLLLTFPEPSPLREPRPLSPVQVLKTAVPPESASVPPPRPVDESQSVSADATVQSRDDDAPSPVPTEWDELESSMLQARPSASAQSAHSEGEPSVPPKPFVTPSPKIRQRLEHWRRMAGVSPAAAASMSAVPSPSAEMGVALPVKNSRPVEPRLALGNLHSPSHSPVVDRLFVPAQISDVQLSSPLSGGTSTSTRSSPPLLKSKPNELPEGSSPDVEPPGASVLSDSAETWSPASKKARLCERSKSSNSPPLLCVGQPSEVSDTCTVPRTPSSTPSPVSSPRLLPMEVVDMLDESSAEVEPMHTFVFAPSRHSDSVTPQSVSEKVGAPAPRLVQAKSPEFAPMLVVRSKSPVILVPRTPLRPPTSLPNEATSVRLTSPVGSATLSAATSSDVSSLSPSESRLSSPFTAERSTSPDMESPRCILQRMLCKVTLPEPVTLPVAATSLLRSTSPAVLTKSPDVVPHLPLALPNLRLPLQELEMMLDTVTPPSTTLQSPGAVSPLTMPHRPSGDELSRFVDMRSVSSASQLPPVQRNMDVVPRPLVHSEWLATVAQLHPAVVATSPSSMSHLQGESVVGRPMASGVSVTPLGSVERGFPGAHSMSFVQLPPPPSRYRVPPALPTASPSVQNGNSANLQPAVVAEMAESSALHRRNSWDEVRSTPRHDNLNSPVHSPRTPVWFMPGAAASARHVTACSTNTVASCLNGCCSSQPSVSAPGMQSKCCAVHRYPGRSMLSASYLLSLIRRASHLLAVQRPVQCSDESPMWTDHFADFVLCQQDALPHPTDVCGSRQPNCRCCVYGGVGNVRPPFPAPLHPPSRSSGPWTGLTDSTRSPRPGLDQRHRVESSPRTNSDCRHLTPSPRYDCRFAMLRHPSGPVSSGVWMPESFFPTVNSVMPCPVPSVANAASGVENDVPSALAWRHTQLSQLQDSPQEPRLSSPMVSCRPDPPLPTDMGRWKYRENPLLNLDVAQCRMTGTNAPPVPCSVDVGRPTGAATVPCPLASTWFVDPREHQDVSPMQSPVRNGRTTMGPPFAESSNGSSAAETSEPLTPLRRSSDSNAGECATSVNALGLPPGPANPSSISAAVAGPDVGPYFQNEAGTDIADGDLCGSAASGRVGQRIAVAEPENRAERPRTNRIPADVFDSPRGEVDMELSASYSASTTLSGVSSEPVTDRKAVMIRGESQLESEVGSVLETGNESLSNDIVHLRPLPIKLKICEDFETGFDPATASGGIFPSDPNVGYEMNGSRSTDRCASARDNGWATSEERESCSLKRTKPMPQDPPAKKSVTSCSVNQQTGKPWPS